MDIYWTKDIPINPGRYLMKRNKNHCIESTVITIKDLAIQSNDPTYLGDCLWSTETIEEYYNNENTNF